MKQEIEETLDNFFDFIWRYFNMQLHNKKDHSYIERMNVLISENDFDKILLLFSEMTHNNLKG